MSEQKPFELVLTWPSVSTLVAVAVAFGVFLALTRRRYTAIALTAYLLGFVLLSSYLKQAFLGSAMTLADMHFFLLRPVENFYLFVNYPFLGLTLIGVFVGVAVLVFLGLRFETPLQILSTARGRWGRWTLGVASVVFGIGAALLASPRDASRANDGDAWAAFQTMYAQLHPGGPMGRINVFFNNRSFEATLPAQRLQQRFKKETISSTLDSANKPDILLVLEESTFDPQMIKACPKALCDNSILHRVPIAKRSTQGPLLVHTSGGGTWLAEFAVAAGFDWRVFGRGGAYAPVSLAPRLRASVPKYLRSLGYRTIAIYPTEGNFLSATTAYEYYGFDEFYARRDLGLPDEWGDVRDSTVFERTFSIADNSADKRPVFIFMLTIRNHGPHGHHPEKIPAPFNEASTQLTPALADYLARMRDSSNDFAAAATRWLESPRTRVIAWFGDHQPEAAWEFTENLDKLVIERLPKNVPSKLSAYITLYQMSANFGAAAHTQNAGALDLAFLSAKLLNFAQLPLDAHAGSALEAAQACGGLLLECTDRDLVSQYLSFRIHELGAVD